MNAFRTNKILEGRLAYTFFRSLRKQELVKSNKTQFETIMYDSDDEDGDAENYPKDMKIPKKFIMTEEDGEGGEGGEAGSSSEYETQTGDESEEYTS